MAPSRLLGPLHRSESDQGIHPKYESGRGSPSGVLATGGASPTSSSGEAAVPQVAARRRPPGARNQEATEQQRADELQQRQLQPLSTDGQQQQQQQQLALARVLAARGRFDDALQALDGAGSSSTTSPQSVSAEVLCFRGRCLAGLGRRPQALAAFAGVLAQEPRHIEALLCCAALYKDSGQLEQALASAEQAAAACEAVEGATATAEAAAGDSSSDGAVDSDEGSDGEAGGVRQQQQQQQPGTKDVAMALAVIHTDFGTQKKLGGQPG